jgi:hypothetical protein
VVNPCLQQPSFTAWLSDFRHPTRDHLFLPRYRDRTIISDTFIDEDLLFLKVLIIMTL